MSNGERRRAPSETTRQQNHAKPYRWNQILHEFRSGLRFETLNKMRTTAESETESECNTSIGQQLETDERIGDVMCIAMW